MGTPQHPVLAAAAAYQALEAFPVKAFPAPAVEAFPVEPHAEKAFPVEPHTVNAFPVQPQVHAV